MGKQKRQRKKPHKENPTGLPSVKDFEDSEDEFPRENREDALRKVYDKIQSASVEEKLSGLQTLESMSCNPTIAMEIAKDGIAKMVGPLLVDPSVLVRAAAASSLRHVVDNGKTEACISLLNDDIMTPLSALLKKYFAEWEPKQEEKGKGKIDDEKEGFIQAVTLLWTLCEDNERAVNYSNNEDLVPILTKFLTVTVYGFEVATVAAQCLLSLTEDNPTAIARLKEHEELLLHLLSAETDDSTVSEAVGLKTPVAGLIMNLINDTENSPVGTVCKVITVLSEVLAIDCKELLGQLTSILPHEKNAFSGSAKKRVRQNRKILGAQQQALEILANLCTESNESEGDSDLDSDAEDCEMDASEDAPMDEGKSDVVTLSLPLEIVEVFNSCNVLERIHEKTIAVDKDTTEILEQNVEGKAVLKQMQTIRCRAYLCLNNLVSSMEIDALGGVDSVHRLWLEIATVVFKDADPNDIELLESATAAMRATLQRLSEANANVFSQLTMEIVQPMLNGERQCPNANVRANLIRILGNFILILVNNNNSEAVELIKNVSTFLLDTCRIETEAWVIAEAFDTIMDVYAEDETDELASKIKLIDKLQALVPIFKTKVRQQRKGLKNNAAIISTVNANITRFIKYKGRRIKKC